MAEVRANGVENPDIRSIGEVLQGRRQSYNPLVQRYQKLVRVVIWNFFRSQADTDEICQEVFLKAYLNLGSLEDPNRFKGWLLKIACRTCIDAKRKKHPGEELVFDFQETWTPEDPGAQRQFDATEVKSLLTVLPAADGMIVWLKYVEGYGYEDIAQMVNASEAAVRQRASRAMKVLRERLKV